MQTGHGAPPPADPLASWNRLLKQKAAALKCFDALEVKLQGMNLQTPATVTTEFGETYGADKACPIGSGWARDRLNVQSKAALENILADLVAADKELRDHEAANTKTQAHEDARTSKMAGLFKQARSNFDAAATIMVNNNAGARTAVMAQLSNIKGGKAKPIVDLLERPLATPAIPVTACSKRPSSTPRRSIPAPRTTELSPPNRRSAPPREPWTSRRP